MKKILASVFITAFALSLFGQVKQSPWTTTTNPATARTGLGLGSLATLNSIPGSSVTSAVPAATHATAADQLYASTNNGVLTQTIVSPVLSTNQLTGANATDTSFNGDYTLINVGFGFWTNTVTHCYFLFQDDDGSTNGNGTGFTWTAFTAGGTLTYGESNYGLPSPINSPLGNWYYANTYAPIIPFTTSWKILSYTTNTVTTPTSDGMAAYVTANAITSGNTNHPIINNLTISNATLIASDVGAYGTLAVDDPDGPACGFWSYLFTRTNWYAGTGGTAIMADVTEQLMFIIATNWINDGLLAMGYNWAGIDAGYSPMSLNSGQIVDTNKFPDGMAFTVAHLHELGFKVKLFYSPLLMADTNSFYTNSLAFANALNQWKIDRLYVDNTGYGRSVNPRGELEAFIRILRAASNNCPIVSLNALGNAPYNSWVGNVFNEWIFSATGDAIGYDALVADMNFALSVDSGIYNRSHRLLLSVLSPSSVLAYADPYGNGIYGEPVLAVGLVSFWHSSQDWTVDCVAEAQRETGQGNGAWATQIAMIQTNKWLLAICKDKLMSKPFLLQTNGTIVCLVDKLYNGTTAVLVNNQGSASNVTATTITLTATAFGFAPNTPANWFEIFGGANYQGTNYQGTNIVIQCNTNRSSVWIVNSPATNNAEWAANYVSATNGFASYATNSITVGSTGVTNTLGKAIVVNFTVGTGCSLFNNQGIAEFSSVAVGAGTQWRVQANGWITGTAITATADAW